MRLFVAVTPGERFVAALSAALDPWRERIGVRWTPPEQWHVTLQFLGDWPETDVPTLQEALVPVAERAPFVVKPGALGAFPSLARPQVLFVHLDGGENLARLAAAARARVAGVRPDGPQDTKPFRAHLTVARVRADLPGDESKLLREIDLSGLPDFPVDGFDLVESRLDSRGARHRGRAFWRLRKKGE